MIQASSSSGSEDAAGSDSTVIKVMVADDSAVIRGLITRMLEAERDIRVVASVPDGRLAIAGLQRHDVDVIVLDIEMPVMDGLTAIPALLAAAPHVKIVMASTLTLKNADISLKALAAGAADYVAKPTATREMMGTATFNRELVEKVRHLGAAARRAGSRPRTVPGARTPVDHPAKPASRPSPVLRTATGVPPLAIAIGSSTGGPQALFQVLKHLESGISQPILLTQHMPPSFTTMLAAHISKQCGIVAVEAQNGMMIEGGTVYVAPGSYHMTIGRSAAGRPPVIRLNQEPPENYCRPSVDPMLRSMIGVYGSRVLAVILTGMGQDGLKGCQELVLAGGTVIAQDEASSVVWGMPGAVANAGLCSAILPLDAIGPRLRQAALKSAA
jgi:two-component system chemotaxis response regulator CheB